MKLNKDVTSGIIGVLISVALFIGALSIEKKEATLIGAGFMPKIIAIIFLIVSILLIIDGWKKPLEKKPSEPPNYKGVIMLILSMIIYVSVLRTIGFVIASTVFLFFTLHLMSKPEEVNNIKFAILSIVVTVAVNFIFMEVFGIRIPQGIL